MNVPHFEQELDYSCLAACTRAAVDYLMIVIRPRDQ